MSFNRVREARQKKKEKTGLNVTQTVFMSVFVALA